MFERKGSIFAPAGMIWSVVILSPVFSETFTVISSAIGSFTGKGLMFGPRTTSTRSASASPAGEMTALSSILNASGIVTEISPPNDLGSVIVPQRADTAAVSGEHK